MIQIRTRLRHLAWIPTALALFSLATSSDARPSKPAPKSAQAKPAPKAAAKSPLATVGNRRRVEEIDILRAAEAFASDPLRKSPAAFKRMLLDRCVDRELLAMEAERRGLGDRPEVRSQIAALELQTLLGQVTKKVLEPSIVPTPEELRQIRAGGLYRFIDLYLIQIRDDQTSSALPIARRILAAAQNGARFDSLARLYSGHPPTRSSGGHFGWIMIRDLPPESRGEAEKAKVGDVLGLFTNPWGHDIYKIAGTREASDDSLFQLVHAERRAGMTRNYEEQLLKKYHFELDSTSVTSVLFTAGTESADSILASLSPEGTRPKIGARPALGALARFDGDSVTFRDLIRLNPPGPGGHIAVHTMEDLSQYCHRVAFPKLAVRDAKERGFDRDPLVARELRLQRDMVLTSSMVARSRPQAPKESVLVGIFRKNQARYNRPKTILVRVLAFNDSGAATQALPALRKAGISDSVLAAREAHIPPRPVRYIPRPEECGLMEIHPGDENAVARATASLKPGEITGTFRLPLGYAVAQVVSVEEARPATLEEARAQIMSEWRHEVESAWVDRELATLRSKTPVQIRSGRLDAIRLSGSVGDARGAVR